MGAGNALLVVNIPSSNVIYLIKFLMNRFIIRSLCSKDHFVPLKIFIDREKPIVLFSLLTSSIANHAMQ